MVLVDAKRQRGQAPPETIYLSFSKEAGAYFYPLKQAREGRVQAQIAPPPGTSEIQICQQHWRRSIDRFEYSDLTLDRVVAFQGSASPSRASLTVLSLLDEFSQACWTPELNLQPLSRERPIEQIEAATSNCLFMESAWPSTASLADNVGPRRLGMISGGPKSW